MELTEIRRELIAAQNLNEVRRTRGKSNLNLVTEIAEEIAAICMEAIEGDPYEVAIASNKGYDIFNEAGKKIEVKSSVSLHRGVGNLKDKSIADQIMVVWFSENSFFSVEKVVLFETGIVLEAVKVDGNKKQVFTNKLQRELFESGQDITEEYKDTISQILSA